MDFMIGCNYWASNAGTDMWRQWDAECVENDFKNLTKYGVEYLRVFPNWRDFQPVHSLKDIRGRINGYYTADDKRVTDEFGLDKDCMQHFRDFVNLAEKYNIKLIVSIVTGWMSGRLFVPPALEGKNLITDNEALKFEIKFVKGFVREFKDAKQIIAWELGNECNCMGNISSSDEEYVWTASISNAIKSEDTSRIIMSGMHSLQALPSQTEWSIKTQAELTDVLCPHPYPSVSVDGDVEPMNGLRTTLIPTFQSVYYSGIGNKPAMIQETGGVSTMVGNKNMAADFLRVNVYSAWANDSLGCLWWCAHEQRHLSQPPYSWGMVERELGLLNQDLSPKPVANAMKQAHDVIKGMPFDKLPPREIDAVCVLTDNWGGDYIKDAEASYMMAKQAGFDMTFAYSKNQIPKKDLYFVPCIEGWSCMLKETYEDLIERAKEGASVCFSVSTGLLTDIEDVFGMYSDGLLKDKTERQVSFGDYTLDVKHDCKFLLRPTTCEVLAQDDDGVVIFARNKIGKGWMYFINYPFERRVVAGVNVLSNTEKYPYYKVYQKVAENVLAHKLVKVNNTNIGITHHKVNDNEYIVTAINYSPKEQNFVLDFPREYNIEVVYGAQSSIAGCDMAVYKVIKK